MRELLGCLVVVAACGGKQVPATVYEDCVQRDPSPTIAAGAPGVEGAVIDADTGTPVVGAAVLAVNGDANRSAQTDGAGHYSLDLAVGDWDVTAMSDERYITARHVPIRAGSRVHLELRMVVCGSARGELIRR